MLTCEYKLVPAQHPRSWLAEAVWMLVLILLLLLLVGGQEMSGSDRFFYDAIGQMTSYFMPAALAMLLALRCGVIDMSVWMSWSAGSVVAACILRAALPGEGQVHAGLWPALAFAAAAGAGAVIGVLNGLLVRVPKFPAVAATAVVALAVWLVLQMAVPTRQTDVHPRAFDGWHVWVSQTQEVTSPSPDQIDDEHPANGQPRPAQVAATREIKVPLPLVITRMLGVFFMFAMVAVTLLIAYSRRASHHQSIDVRDLPQARWVALVTGAVISALGGALWLLENSHATVPRLPVHDLRIPAAAVLAGSLVLAGRGRLLLAVICLPPTMLLATQWYVGGWDLNTNGLALQMLVLLAMAVLASLALRTLVARGGRLAIAAAVCSVLAMLVLARTVDITSAARVLQWTSVGLAAAGAVLLTIAAAQGRRVTSDE